VPVTPPRPSLKSIVLELEEMLGSSVAVHHMIHRPLIGTDPVQVPYTNCGQPSDIITLESITSTVWPPQLGAEADLVVNLLANAEVDAGTYTAVVSVDGFPLITKNGNLSKYVKLPVAKGPLTITKAIKLPSSIPFSGSIGIQFSAQDADSNELFCLQISFDI